MTSPADFASALPPLPAERPDRNWLSAPPKSRAGVYRSSSPKEIVLDNGLVQRVFRVTPEFATVHLVNHNSGQSLLRAVKPEARITLNGKNYAIGGLTGQPNLAFLRPEWLEQMPPTADAFRLTKLELAQVRAPFAWKGFNENTSKAAWPPAGAGLVASFADPAHPEVTVRIRYEIYAGIPCVMKQVEVENRSGAKVELDQMTTEILALAEVQSEVDAYANWTLPPVDAISDYSFGGMSASAANRTLQWVPDPDYTTQVNYELKTPCMLESRPPIGPGYAIAPGETFTSHRSILVLYDNDRREHRGLTIRRAYRTLAPWITENPIMLHLTTIEPKTAQLAMDQAAECGFEVVIFSFGSGIDAEDASPANIAKIKALVEYGHAKGLKVGCYSLLASRSISPKDDVINPKTGKTGGTIFGNSPCLGSEWGIRYFKNLREVFEKTGMDLLEHDGNYPGDVCASENHPGHRGTADSQWRQWRQITDLYAWCRSRGIYLNVPDWYVLAGSNKTGMGYRETNWSLPRAMQHLHARQNMFDGTWTKTPSTGWMFVPLTQYHGGGAAATIEPLRENLPDYEQHLANCFGYGVQACYRGPRLYDSPETKAVVLRWVKFFKEHRAILESDVVHLRRADGRDVDAILHVNPTLPERGMLVVYNPLGKEVTREIEVPIEFTGLTSRVQVTDETGRAVSMRPKDGSIRVKLKVPPVGLAYRILR